MCAYRRTKETERARRSDALYYDEVSRRRLCDMIAYLESKLYEAGQEADGRAGVRRMWGGVPNMAEVKQAKRAEPRQAHALHDMQEGDGTHGEKGLVMPEDMVQTINEISLDVFNRVVKMLAARTVKVSLDSGAFMPERAHSTDAGADIRTPTDFTLPACGSVTVDTGVHVQLPSMTKCDIRSKSGLNIKCDIITEGLVDEGFSGSIKVRMHNLSDKEYHFERGDKITQIVVTPVYYPEFEQVAIVEGGERGDAGYGSTGR